VHLAVVYYYSRVNNPTLTNSNSNNAVRRGDVVALNKQICLVLKYNSTPNWPSYDQFTSCIIDTGLKLLDSQVNK
jgi:hypothetical protein